MDSDGSLYFVSIRELKKRKTAFWGLIVILFAIFISFFAYLFVPDNSPNANRQIPEISLKRPGFRYNAVLIPNNMENKRFFLESLFGGFKESYDIVPFERITFMDREVQILTLSGKMLVLPFDSFKTGKNEITADFIKSNCVKNYTSLLGTDRFGRDLLSRIVLGIRISLLAGFLAVFVSLFVGVTLGAVAGYFGGWADSIILYLINVIWSIPTLLLVFAIVLAMGRGIFVIFIAVGLTMWVDVARLVRGLVLSLKQEQFVMAAKSTGQKSGVILGMHILPNTIGPVLVITAANFATAILVEAGLSYLGFGVEPPAPSLGNLLNENYGYALSGNVFIAVFPAIAVMSLVLAFNLLGSGLRDIFDVRRKE